MPISLEAAEIGPPSESSSTKGVRPPCRGRPPCRMPGRDSSSPADDCSTDCASIGPTSRRELVERYGGGVAERAGVPPALGGREGVLRLYPSPSVTRRSSVTNGNAALRRMSDSASAPSQHFFPRRANTNTIWRRLSMTQERLPRASVICAPVDMYIFDRPSPAGGLPVRDLTDVVDSALRRGVLSTSPSRASVRDAITPGHVLSGFGAVQCPCAVQRLAGSRPRGLPGAGGPANR